MIVDELKKSILQIATEGKIVHQNFDFIAKLELEEILKEQKEDKKYIYNNIETPPFSIPNNWIWVKLEDICLKITDGTHSTPKYSSSGIPFISVKDVSNGCINFNNTKFITESEHKILFSRCNPEYGDLLITKIGTTGVPAIIETKDEFSLFVSVALLKFNQKLINNKWLYYFLKSPIVQNQVKENTRGVGNKNWVLDAIKNTILPLPPVEEQQRIVDKIEDLFTKIDEIKPIEEELNNIKEEFPNEMKKAILKESFDGKYSSLSFENWITDKLINACNEICTGNSISESIKKTKYTNLNTGHNYISTKDLNFDHSFNYENGIKIPFEETNFKCANVGDILLCIEGGSAGKKIGILEEKVCYGNKLCKFSSSKLNPKFLYYYLQSPQFIKNFYGNISGIIGGVSINKIKTINISFPPLEEQQRIVDKLEQLLPLCVDIERIINE